MADSRRGPRPLDARDDDALARAVVAGSTEALEALYRRYADLVHGAAYRITGSTLDAEDVLQDVFVGLARALRRYEERGRFAGWIRSVATRVALMKVRGRERLRWQALPGEIEDPAAGPDGAVDRVVAAELLGTMPDRLRRVFLLREVDGYGHAEIAALLGISTGASRVRLHRAWTWLRRQVGDGEAP